MKAVIKMLFALVAGILFLLVAWLIFKRAVSTPMFEPNDAQTFILDMVGAGIVAFIAAQLGISVGSTGATLFDKMKDGMGSQSKLAGGLLVFDTVVVVLAGIGFVLLWVKPDLIAVPEGDPALNQAPEYIATQARAFVGLVLAATAALGTSVK